MEPKRYPQQLSRGANNAVIALSKTEAKTEAGKLFGGDTRSEYWLGSGEDAFCQRQQ